MYELISKSEYEEIIEESRDIRMGWWREARFGMFIHYGLYSVEGKHEWAMAMENWDPDEYAKFADGLLTKPNACREWAALAKKAGMKYMVLTTRHHEGFSLWNSKVNPFNSVNYGPKRDIVREFVNACREYGLKIGFYSSLMDWKNPDGAACVADSAARLRFTKYIQELNRELMTNYGTIDILWYDVPSPLTSWEGWDSLSLNKMVRDLQPDIIINNRSRLDEDFSTPEGRIEAKERDWESCMTFNGMSWGYIDSEQAKPYSYSPQQILRMLYQVTKDGGNLLLNIGPSPDGSVPQEAVMPLTNVGKWIDENHHFIYGIKQRKGITYHSTSGVSFEGKRAYVWNFIWPKDGKIIIGGILTKLKDAKLVLDGTPIEFDQDQYQIILKNLPSSIPDKSLGITMICLEFENDIKYCKGLRNPQSSRYPQINEGRYFKP